MMHTTVGRRAVLATALAGFFLPIEALAAVEFKTIQDPAFVGRGPGPDGFVGTADDVLDPNNTAGTVAYAISSQLLFLYSEATTTINEPFVFENGRSIVTDFTTSGSLVPGFSFTDDLTSVIPGISLPHEMWTDLQGRTDGEYYLTRCTGGAAVRATRQLPRSPACQLLQPIESGARLLPPTWRRPVRASRDRPGPRALPRPADGSRAR